MAQAITYNNLVDLFRAYQVNNISLQRYGNGSLKDLESVISVERTFPVMWSNLVQINYPFQNNIYNTKLYTFNVLFMDILSIDKANEQDVWSDSIQLAEDFLKWLNLHCKNVYEVMPSPVVTTFTERFGDYVAGCNVKLIIQVDADLWNNCNTPVVQFPFNNMPITNIQ